MTPHRLLPLAFATVLLIVTPAGFGQGDPAAEKSVKPGINKDYLVPNLDISKFVERFEKEGREIYDQRQQIVSAVKLKPGSAVADIGAGTGLFTMLFAEVVGPEGKVYAVDIVKEFVDHIGKRAKETGRNNVQPVLCTDRSTELPPNSIDTGFLCDVYHHFEYPQHSLASIHRALKSGGELVVVDFKRVPGKSSDWILNHVRAGQETVIAEIEAAGFKKVEEQEFLKQNYFVRFRKVDAK